MLDLTTLANQALSTLVFVLIGMIADMLRMIRLNAEQLLYFEKRRHYRQTAYRQ